MKVRKMKKIKKFIVSPYGIAGLFALKMMVYYALIDVRRMELILILISMAVWGIIFVLLEDVD